MYSLYLNCFRYNVSEDTWGLAKLWYTHFLLPQDSQGKYSPGTYTVRSIQSCDVISNMYLQSSVVLAVGPRLEHRMLCAHTSPQTVVTLSTDISVQSSKRHELACYVFRNCTKSGLTNGVHVFIYPNKFKESQCKNHILPIQTLMGQWPFKMDGHRSYNNAVPTATAT